jgi:DNA-binding CsgD family transcriptional regulator
MDLAEKYMPLAERMAKKYHWDEEALARAYYGMMIGISRLPEDHPNPGGYIANYIKSQLIIKSPPVIMGPLCWDPSHIVGDPPDYIIEEISHTAEERTVAEFLYEGYSTRETAKLMEIAHNRVWEIRKRLQERLNNVLGK